MYPECRHVRPGGSTCNSPSIKGNYWCYFHSRLHERQTIHHNHRLANGRFAPLPEAGTAIDQAPALRGTAAGRAQSGAGGATLVGSPGLNLPPVEDAASIQLALIDVLQALAADQLDPRRAGLLLFGLQVASANVKNLTRGDVRAVTHTEDGTPLAPQNYGYDIEDYEECADEDEEEEED